ncbi:ABC transporter ATP-binding protein [uncultured Tessaracoccus sp.]|uniref:ABC transporter ATP-binding protein n=1 Tax=uncultured Tessaracoccus sp. TaxID=905023 RepID=UPI0025D92492|nr:ABC transporter ATP-binding protein [uncultured Tessaracoccus sp.]
MSNALVARDVRLRFGARRALDGLDLTADAGSVCALLGPNGAGKTTFIRCCTALLRPDSGTISICGHAPGTPGARAVVGLMPQRTGAWAAATPARLLTYLAGLYADPQPVDELMALLGIHDFAGTQYRRLSGGQQQAVNLAGALVGRPALVFLDEPTAGLDPRARATTWALVRSVRDAGVAVVLTTHDMAEAEALSDHVTILHRGRVRATGTVDELRATHGTLERAFLTSTEAPE